MKRAELASRESDMVTHMLVEAREAERHRIARDLHDHLGPQVTGLRLKIQSLYDKVAAHREFGPDLENLREITAQMDREIGFLSWGLRSIELNDLGLSKALASFVRAWSRQYGIRAEYQHNLSGVRLADGRLDHRLEANLYRIAQEALNNILKHADASNVCVILQTNRDSVVLIIEDNGKGFDFVYRPSGVSNFSGLGLVGMQERVASLNGELEIESSLGNGTTIIVRMPIR